MAFNTASTAVDSFEVPGSGLQAYLFSYPVTGYTGGTLALKQAAAYVLAGYTDGTKKTGMTGNIWGSFDSNGLQVKFKGLPIEVDKNNGAKHPIGFQNFEADIEGTFYDCDETHIRDIVSATTGEEITIAAGVGQVGSKTVLVGSQKNIRMFGMMIRVPSVMVTTGTVPAFDHYFFPKVVIVPDADLKFSKKEPLMCKVKITALYDSTFLSPDNSQPILYWYEQATGAAS